MFLLVRSPTGSLTSLDLGAIPSWDIGVETRPVGWQGHDYACLVVMISAPINGMMVRVVLDALDTQSRGDELAQVIAVGLSKGGDRSEDKARFAEALKILTNAGLPEKAIDEVIANSAALIDGFWNFRDAAWGTPPSLMSMQPIIGQHTNKASKYSWVLSETRRGALLIPAVPLPSAEPELIQVEAEAVVETPPKKERKAFPPRHK